jgi:hypothetical protein
VTDCTTGCMRNGATAPTSEKRFFNFGRHPLLPVRPSAVLAPVRPLPKLLASLRLDSAHGLVCSGTRSLLRGRPLTSLLLLLLPQRCDTHSTKQWRRAYTLHCTALYCTTGSSAAVAPPECTRALHSEQRPAAVAISSQQHSHSSVRSVPSP